MLGKPLAGKLLNDHRRFPGMGFQRRVENSGLIHRRKPHPVAELGVDDLAQEILQPLVGQPGKKTPRELAEFLRSAQVRERRPHRVRVGGEQRVKLGRQDIVDGSNDGPIGQPAQIGSLPVALHATVQRLGDGRGDIDQGGFRGETDACRRQVLKDVGLLGGNRHLRHQPDGLGVAHILHDE